MSSGSVSKPATAGSGSNGVLDSAFEAGDQAAVVPKTQLNMICRSRRLFIGNLHFVQLGERPVSSRPQVVTGTDSTRNPSEPGYKPFASGCMFAAHPAVPTDCLLPP